MRPAPMRGAASRAPLVLSCCEAMEEGAIVPGLFGCRVPDDSENGNNATGHFLIDASEFGSEKRREKLVRRHEQGLHNYM